MSNNVLMKYKGDDKIKLEDKLYCPLCKSSEIEICQNRFVDWPVRKNQDGKKTKIKCIYTTCNKCKYITLVKAKVTLA